MIAKYFQTININDSVSWVKYAVWSDRSTYCYLEIYELWAFISGRQFLATETKDFLKIPQHFQLDLIIVIFRSLPVPGHSQEWRPLIPFPNFGNGFFSFPSRSRISGMDFFHSLPVPELWEWIFLFPSRSRISGMGFFNSLPVPEFREWFF